MKCKYAITNIIQCMRQGVNLESERNNPLFKP